MKGQMTLINAVMIILTFIFLAATSGLWYPVLNNVLLPNLTAGSMNWYLAVFIFPVIIIGLLVIIWLWARPFI